MLDSEFTKQHSSPVPMVVPISRQSNRSAFGGFLVGLVASCVVFSISPIGPTLKTEIRSTLRGMSGQIGSLLGLRSGSSLFGTSFGTSELSREDLRELVYVASKKYQVPAELVWAVISVESGFNQNAKSPVGAIGLMQLMPTTARAMGVEDPWDPYQNVIGGTLYLRRLLTRYQGKHHLALAAYNAGPGAVSKYGGIPPFRETRNYVTRVMEVYEFERRKRSTPISLS